MLVFQNLKGNFLSWLVPIGEPVQARLSDAIDNTTQARRVELLYNRTWTELCADGWNEKHSESPMSTARLFARCPGQIRN